MSADQQDTRLPKASEPAVNPERLHKLTGGDNRLANELFELWSESMAKETTALQAALAQADLHQIGFHAHTIMGASRNLGIDEVGRIAKELELQSREGWSEGLAGLCRDLAKEMDLARVFFRGYLGTVSG